MAALFCLGSFGLVTALPLYFFIVAALSSATRTVVRPRPLSAAMSPSMAGLMVALQPSPYFAFRTLWLVTSTLSGGALGMDVILCGLGEESGTVEFADE